MSSPSPPREIALFASLLVLTSLYAPHGDAQDLSTDEGVAAAVIEATGAHFDPEYICVQRPSDLPGIILVADLVMDAGCLAQGGLVEGEYFPWSDLSQRALGHLGWADASPERRTELAWLWIRRGIYAFGSGVLERPDAAFDREDTPAFTPPSIVANPDGGVTAEYWTADSSGMLPETRYQRVRLVFGPDGAIASSDRFDPFTIQH